MLFFAAKLLKILGVVVTVAVMTRKQREIQQRHELILDKARGLFVQHGYHSVTMDMIAKEMEYSKGTIYQHFNSKEVIIFSLCTRLCRLMFSLISDVGDQTQLNPRMQMLLIQEAFILIQELCQDDVQIKNLADSESFKTKVPDIVINESILIDQKTFAIVVQIVNRAIDKKQLHLGAQASSDDVAMGCWALAHGIYLLTETNSCAANLKLSPPKQLLRLNSQLFLDGAGWEKFTITDKRMQFIEQYTQKFKTTIHKHYHSTL